MAANLHDPAYWDTAILRGTGRLFMLAALADRPRHGYDIARHITEMLGGCCSPSDAMIYPGIRDLVQAGLVVCRTETAGGRTRNVCSLTDEGEEALRTAARVWARYLPALQTVVLNALDESPRERERQSMTGGTAVGRGGCC